MRNADKVRCPWCREPMKRGMHTIEVQDGPPRYSAQYWCINPECEASGPLVGGEEGFATREEAIRVAFDRTFRRW